MTALLIVGALVLVVLVVVFVIVLRELSGEKREGGD